MGILGVCGATERRRDGWMMASGREGTGRRTRRTGHRSWGRVQLGEQAARTGDAGVNAVDVPWTEPPVPPPGGGLRAHPPRAGQFTQRSFRGGGHPGRSTRRARHRIGSRSFRIAVGRRGERRGHQALPGPIPPSHHARRSPPVCAWEYVRARRPPSWPAADPGTVGHVVRPATGAGQPRLQPRHLRRHRRPARRRAAGRGHAPLPGRGRGVPRPDPGARGRTAPAGRAGRRVGAALRRRVRRGRPRGRRAPLDDGRHGAPAPCRPPPEPHQRSDPRRRAAPLVVLRRPPCDQRRGRRRYRRAARRGHLHRSPGRARSRGGGVAPVP